MNNKQFIGQIVSSFEKYDEVGPITGIALLIDDEQEFRAGSEDGYVLEVSCPYGTQEMANTILQNVSGKTYRGFRAKNASLPVTAELGDAVTVNRTYSFLAYQNLNFGPNNRSEIAAPGTHEAEHEYPYLTSTQREFDRRIADVRSYIIKENDRIQLLVEQTNADVAEIYSSLTLDLSGMRAEYTDSIAEVSTTLTMDINGLRTDYTNDIAGVRTELEAGIDGLRVEYVNAIEGVETNFNMGLENIQLNYATKEDLTETEAQITLDRDQVLLSYAKTDDVNNTVSTAIRLSEEGIAATYMTSDGVNNLITNSKDGIKLSVSNGEKTSTLTLTYGKTELSSGTIKFNGNVVFASDLSDGTTVISGDNIKTGTVSLDRLELNNRYGGIEMDNGNNGVVETAGIKMYNDSARYLIITDSACRITTVQTHFYVATNKVYSSVAIDEGSDQRIKNTITYDVAEVYEPFYRLLKPARYHRNDSKSGRFHTGFIAQQMEEALIDSGLTTTDLAAFVHATYEEDPDELYSIRYTEMVPINTAMIQRLMDRVDELESEVARLRNES